MHGAGYEHVATAVIIQAILDLKYPNLMDEALDFLTSERPHVAKLREFWFDVARTPLGMRALLASLDRDAVLRAQRSTLDFPAALHGEMTRGSSRGSSRMVPAGSALNGSCQQAE